MQGLTKFEKWVKIRIGEPITAIDLDNEWVVFGSISGYLGFYNIQRNDLKYIQEVFEEIVRGIHITSDKKAFICIGDYQGLYLDIEKRDYTSVKYDQRAHNPSLCSSTLSMLSQSTVVLLLVAPTQNKDLIIDIDKNKNKIYKVELKSMPEMVQNSNIKNDLKMEEFNPSMPKLYVPFDFDGDRILFLEYLQNAKKQLLLLNFTAPEIQMLPIYSIPQSVEFISFGRLAKNYIIYVEDHKKVKAFDTKKMSDILLFTMDSNIIAFDVMDTELAKQPSEEEEKQVQQRPSEGVQNLSFLQVSAIDYNCTLRVWHQQKLVQNFNLLKIPNVPIELVKHKYLFDMGYPYYMRFKYNQLAVTSDLGILIFTI